MKAIFYDRYGSPDVLELREIDKPVPGNGEVLVKVSAASVNPYDHHFLTGTPYILRAMAGLRRPKQNVLGIDFSGVVEAVGANVEGLQVGDEVFGMRSGAFAEYLCVAEVVAKKPANLTFAQAAAVPMAALTALQGLRDKGEIQAGQKVLVNGASGGVGTFAVQIAKAFGAEVTGVCSTPNVEMVRALGADHIIDYTKVDYTHSGRQYDLILDTSATRSFPDRMRVMTPTGTLVEVGGPIDRWAIGYLTSDLKMRLARRSGTRKLTGMLATANRPDLVTVSDLLAAGKIAPVIERTYALADAPRALAHVGEGHARGKTVLTV